MFFRSHKREKHVTGQRVLASWLSSARKHKENGLKWCQWSLQSDSVRSLTLRSRFLARPWTVAGLAIDRLISQANVGVKGFRKFGVGPLLLACIQDECVRASFSTASPSEA